MEGDREEKYRVIWSPWSPQVLALQWLGCELEVDKENPDATKAVWSETIRRGLFYNKVLRWLVVGGFL
jgi:hypothetical protein